MYNIHKSAASGVWSGEVCKGPFDSRTEAKEYLHRLASAREESGYCVSWLDRNTLEITHDNMADAFTYSIAREE